MLFSIMIYDEPDTAALRDQYRARHLEYLKAFDDQTVFAGPFVTDDESADLGSLRLIDFPDRAAAEKHVAEEPYVIGGFQKRWEIHRWRGTLPYTWRDCPRTEGNVQALFYGLDNPGGMALRTEYREAHEAYLNDHPDNFMTRGPLLDDSGEESIGSLMLLDVPDVDTARRILEGDPFRKAGVYKEVAVYRWRFGRVLDRFKN
jgi:uncharacterized protein YciI